MLLREELTELKQIQIQKKKEDMKNDVDNVNKEDEKKGEIKTNKENIKQNEDLEKKQRVPQKEKNHKKHEDKKVEDVVYKKNNQHTEKNNKPKKPYSEAVKAKNKPIFKIVWLGTSISKVLDQKKFEKDTKTNLKVIKAYGIKKEQNQRFPASNFTDIVPKVIKNENPDAIVLQTGSIEITNIDVKKALMDPSNSIEEYKAEWTRKVKDDSTNLFNHD